VSACFCVVLSCVSVEALCWTDPPTKESYQCLWIEKSIKEGQGPIRTVEASQKKVIDLLTKVRVFLLIKAMLPVIHIYCCTGCSSRKSFQQSEFYFRFYFPPSQVPVPCNSALTAFNKIPVVFVWAWNLIYHCNRTTQCGGVSAQQLIQMFRSFQICDITVQLHHGTTTWLCKVR
jgi:hypothetical protein